MKNFMLSKSCLHWVRPSIGYSFQVKVWHEKPTVLVVEICKARQSEGNSYSTSKYFFHLIEIDQKKCFEWVTKWFHLRETTELVYSKRYSRLLMKIRNNWGPKMEIMDHFYYFWRSYVCNNKVRRYRWLTHWHDTIRWIPLNERSWS